ncbi:hypothetical protein F544_20760 [Bibersteinia trehalosi USDA-ARS-USMARC-190]|uniref:Uncharacterized protein n=1 Tax=Bibersteinia trehalosi USDA-ARS-USMARC-190 TaxID=1263832 RepID=W0R878_BIBTR|nr:hypothetical protein F544_20760 [Bibersteinia trehalosi USDA-ARS-USMARC-190]
MKAWEKVGKLWEVGIKNWEKWEKIRMLECKILYFPYNHKTR